MKHPSYKTNAFTLIPLITRIFQPVLSRPAQRNLAPVCIECEDVQGSQ